MKDYKQIQMDESAYSRGTQWGERVLDSVRRSEFFLKGKVLSVGCGDGLEVEALQQVCEVVKGVDISSDKVKIAQDRGLDVVEGIMEELPFKDKEFDVVYCSHTLEHSNDLDKALQEIQRVGRRAIIFVPLEEHTENEGHFSPIPNHVYLKNKISGKVIYERLLFRGEQELCLVVDYE